MLLLPGFSLLAQACALEPLAVASQLAGRRLYTPMAFGLDARAVLAQSALETGWGQRMIHAPDGASSHNLFGIKAGSSWDGPTTRITTHEVEDGQRQRIRDDFRVYGSFEELDDPDDSYDIIWSQDSFLHSGERLKVMDEIARIIRPGGELIFTDPMQADDCPDGVLDHILRRIHLQTFGSVAFYRHALEKRGFKALDLDETPMNLRTHYNRVREVLLDRREELTRLSGADYVDGMIDGLKHWVDGADKGYLNWGILHFAKA